MRTLIAAAVVAPLLGSGIALAQSGGTQPGRYAVDVEALAWWFKSSPTPTPIITDGVFGKPGTHVLLGGGDMDTNPNAGLRLTAGHALNARWALEGNFLYFGSRSTRNGVSSSGEAGSTDLLLPYYDVTLNREATTEISLAPVYAGSATVELKNSLMGAEGNASYGLDAARPWSVDVVGGFRWLQLKETYTITTSSPFIPPGPAGDVWQTTDRFAARNDFYGGQLGVRARYDGDRWFTKGLLMVGLGAMVQSVDVDGSLLTNDFNHFGNAQTFQGGYFALPSNIGGHSRTVFAVVPELRLDVGYRITPAASIHVGYSVLFANDVARPGNQVDRNINPTQSASWTEDPNATLTGPARPAFSFRSSSFWAQGVSLGLEVRF
jgi:hypothetical protein